MLKRISSLFISVLLIVSCIGTISIPAMAEETEDVKVFGLFSDTHDAKRTKADGSSASNSNGGIGNVMSDIFARANVTADDLSGLDGVVMAGDIVYMAGDGSGGMADGDETAYNTWSANANVQAVKNTDKLVYAMGNHEIPLHAASSDVIENCRTLFKTNTGLDPEHVKVLGGYTFIAAGAQDYNPGTYTGREAWMKSEIEKALNDGANKPVFLVVHHPMADSFYNTAEESYNSGVYSDEFKSYVMSQPRLVVISGHVHTPTANPQTIRQIENGCTFVQTPHVSGGNGVSDPYADASGDMASGAMMMEISSDNVVTFKRFHVNGSGGEAFREDWVLDIPAMVSGQSGAYKYTDARFNESKAPYFAEDAVGTVSDITSNSAIIKFPVATPGDSSETSQVQYYKYTVMDMDNAKLVKEETLLSDFYKPDSRKSSEWTYSLSALTGGTSYRVEITPVSAFYVEADNPLVVDFTTEKEVSYIGDKIVKALDAAGTNVTDTNLARENNKSNGYGTNYGGSWAISTGYVTMQFDITDPGIYRFTSKVASGGATGKIVITNTADASDTKTVTANVTTGGFSVPNESFYWTDMALYEGSYTVTVSRPSGDSLRLYNITTGKIGEITAGDIGYNIKQTVQERTDGIYLGDPNHVSGTGSALTAKNNAYITWSLTPEYSGVYSIAVDFNADADATCHLYNSTYAQKSDENKMGEATVNTGYGKTNVVDFGNIAMVKGCTYTFTLYSPSTNTAASPYIKYILATWEDEINVEETPVSISKSWSDRTDTSITSSWAGMDDGEWITFDVTIPADGNYKAIVTAGVHIGIDITVSGAGQTAAASLEKTADNNTDNLAWNTKKDFEIGMFSLRAGTYEFKVSSAVPSGSGTALFSKLTFDSVSAYELITDSLTVNTLDYDRIDTDISSGHIGSKGIYLAYDNTWLDYDISVGAGNYALSILYGVYSSDPATSQPTSVATVIIDGETYGKYHLPFAQGYTSGSATIELDTIRLTEGDHTIRFAWFTGGEGNDKGYAMSNFSLKAIEAPATKLYSGTAADSSKLLTALTDTDGSIIARTMLPRDVNGKPVTMIFAIYEGDTLYKLAHTSITGKNNSVAAAIIDDIKFEDGKTYTSKVFIIDSINNLVPYYSVTGELSR